MICPKYKTIFFHAPKTAGTSIEQAFGEKNILSRDGKHANVLEIKNHLCLNIKKPMIYENYFKFTFTRNPFGLIFSFYCFHSNLGGNSPFRLEEGGKLDTFEKFILEVGENGLSGSIIRDWANKRNAAKCFGRVNQKQFAYIDGEMEIDFIGRFENLEKDFKVVSKVVGLDSVLPHRNNSRKPRPYWSNYTYETREIVEKLLKEDLETVNYCF